MLVAWDNTHASGLLCENQCGKSIVMTKPQLVYPIPPV